MIEDVLKKLGLDTKEAKIYLALVKFGPSPASSVSKEVSLPRQTVYTLLQGLVTREFVAQGDRRGVKQFIADPGSLIQLLEKQKTALDERQKAIEKEMPKLLSLQKRKEPFVRVQYYEGKDGMKRLFESILDYYRRGETKEFRGYGVNMMHEAMGDYLFEFIRRRHELGVKTNLFIAKGPDDFGITDPSKAAGRTVKRLNMEPQMSGMYLVGDRIYLFSFDDHVGVMVENASIARLTRVVFDDQWGRVPGDA